MTLTATAALAAGAVSAKIAWRYLHPMPVGVAGGASGLTGGKLLYAGGTTWTGGVKRWLRDVRLYDLTRGSWASGPPLPEPLAYGGSAVTGDGFEVFGGMNQEGPSRNCWRADPGVTSWIRTGVLPQDSVLTRVEQVGEAAYMFGGCPDTADLTRCSGSVWMRDRRGKWARIGDMPDGAVMLRASAVLDGRVYLFGGCSADAGGILNRDNAWRYDPGATGWRKLRPLPVPVRGLSAAAVDGRRIALVGGYTASASDAAAHGADYGFSSRVWIYDIGRDRYDGATPLPFAASGIGIAVRAGTIFGLGGEDRMRGRSRRCIQGRIE